ncbi:ArsR/SmtB family transcription factor [Phytoactinopolyspora halotolerans]|uniref:Helix-turn-helix domain-containing protein n=1 Tax=Phytoactinopolyspora halotolerans TaxID=1981512 RepID=A0A6L9S651_9ACTN|nr:helix-turn-helix domain-containing protein [Phytoactinopolyspora halotolerans]NEE00002.1 helix-turn-helix domain-containing protein [Phytoactinopolyspora halotolerans]
MAHEKRQPWPIEPDPHRDVLLGSRSLRAVAHPVRLRILGLLRVEGPATATTLAVKLGLNSGATSYHLRQLAAGGLIAEDEERGTGRDRWWRAVHRSSVLKVDELEEDDRDAGAAYLRAIALVYAEKMQRAAEERPMLPRRWREAATFSDFPFLLTPDEATQLLREIQQVVARYRPLGDPAAQRSADVPADARPFHLQMQAFLQPGQDVVGDADEPFGDVDEPVDGRDDEDVGSARDGQDGG